MHRDRDRDLENNSTATTDRKYKTQFEMSYAGEHAEYASILLQILNYLFINIILFVLKVQPNTTYKLFARKKKQTEVHRKKVQ